MDYTIVYIISIVVFVGCLFYISTYLKKKNLLDPETIQFVSDTLSLSVSILSEMKLPQDDKIKLITTVITEALDYAKKNSISTDINEQKIIAKGYAGVLMGNFGIDLTESRRSIIENLIDLSLRELN